jgi:aspartyl-tRNA(Asn)/glutamyl-tRNA(Gln) amidotransferase subunit A
MSDNELAFASIEQVGRLFRKRKVSPVEVTRFMLDRIDLLNPKLNAYITVCAQLALAQAKKAESELFATGGRKGHRDRGPLHGIPISLKDNISTKDIRTTAGSKILRDFVPLRDAVVVSRLKEAGAVILGKTNLHEFAYGVTSNNPHFGPVRNPWDLSRIPGGSSGGSAAALAAGLCYGSIGTDTGGSIRIPASLCGVVGLKPHYRRVSTEGVVPLSKSLDHVGPLARTVADVAILLQVVTKGGFLDGSSRKKLIPFSLRGTNEIRTKPQRRPICIGLPQGFFWDRLDSEVHSILNAAIENGARFGIVFEEYQSKSVANWNESSTQIALAEATAFHQQQGWYPERSSEYGADVCTRLEMGMEVRASDYIAAQEKRNTAWMGLWSTSKRTGRPMDALLVPTTPFAAPKIGEEEVLVAGEKELVRTGLLRLNRPANYAKLPAISLTCGFTAAGLPVGMQLIGLGWSEKAVLQLAQAFQTAQDCYLRRPPRL